MKKKSFFLLTLLLTLVLALAACSGGSKESSKDGKDSGKKTESRSFPMEVENEGEPIKGGVLQAALPSTSPFKGIFLQELYTDSNDSSIMKFASNIIFENDGDFLVTDEGLATLKVDADANKAIVKIRENVKWSDGEPFTIDDVIFSYEIIGHPDYDGVRYDDDFQNIVGAEEYHDKKADTISGLKRVDDHTLEISFKSISPAIYSGGDGLWSSAAPKHQLKDIPVKEMVSSDAVRVNPVTLGAFKFDKIVNGESVKFVKNEHYWKGEPKLDGVVVKVVSPETLPKALNSGTYDITVGSFPGSKITQIENSKNLAILSRPQLAYSYLSFKLGKFDKSKGINITDENAKLSDPKLRQALAYAIDVEGVNEKLSNGIHTRATTLIPPAFASFHTKDMQGFTHDATKAKQLLDETGYKDVDGDGIREDKDGKPFTIKLGAQGGTEVLESTIEYYRQNWKEVGINVELASGRLMEFNSFSDKLKKDDPEIEMFFGSWGTGTNPSPKGLYGEGTLFNYSRFVSPELSAILDDIDSKESIDLNHRKDAFRKFEEYMFEQATTIPTVAITEIIPVNKRVKNYNVDYANETQYQDIELTADAPLKN
ncbi:oligopeptide ABC transporter substrate-binding protein [Lysinibacillus fusiformis]|nr:oligopeptide ABC transporter substrate-binding protein [Lysinibacillus fusiformis]